MKSTCALLENELETRYRVSLMTSPVEAILWAAERLIETKGLEAAQDQLSAANRLREKQGKIGAYPAYGTQLFHKVSDKRKASARKGAATRARNIANRPNWMK